MSRDAETPDSDAGLSVGDDPDSSLVLDSSSADADAPDAQTDGGPVELGRLTGRIVAASSRQPLSGVKVSASGVTGVSGSDGSFELSGVPVGGRVIVKLAHDAYAPGIEVTSVVTGEPSPVTFVMLEIAAQATFNAAEGGGVESAAGASAKFPAGSIVRHDGTPVSGDVTLRLAPIDVRNAAARHAFPGEFVGERADGTWGLLDSVSPMSITLEQGGELLNVKSGTSALVTFPANGFHYPSIELWSLDESTGRWVEEGLAYLMTDELGRKVYRAEIKHLSWWNCDRVYSGWDPDAPNAQPPPDRACVRGCVKGAPNVITLNYRDMPVPGIGQGWVEGVDYTYGSFDLTDGNGCFALDVMPNGTVKVWAEAYVGKSKSVVIQVPPTGATARVNPAQCTDVGWLVLEPIIVAQCIGLPGSFPAYCDAPPNCVDLLSDENHCGACHRSCAAVGEGGRTALECVGGECRCPGNFATCGLYDCIDTRRDRRHCGACNNACATGTECSEGKCVPIQCGPGLTLCGNDCVDTSTNESHCGACNAFCGGEGGDGQLSCQGGACVCSANLTKCERFNSAYCVDTQTSFTNCGACGNACGVGQECVTGQCQTIQCPPQQTLCGFECADLSTSTAHCGACNQHCYDNGRGLCSGTSADPEGGCEQCQAGSCACANGLTDCDSSNDPLRLDCRDLQSDRTSCGACGNHCITGETCLGGTCVPITCPIGQTLCGNDCVDLSSDPSHCGGCADACPAAGQTGSIQCLDGACGCPAGTLACRGVSLGEGSSLICTDAPASCAAQPASSCGVVEGEWALDVCGTPLRMNVEQIGCAFADTASSIVGEFTDTNALTAIYQGSRTCTAVLSGDTISGSCVDAWGSCAFTGVRPACSAGKTLCGSSCQDLQNDSSNCGFCHNYCGAQAACKQGQCVEAGRVPGDPCYAQYPYCNAGLICDVDTTTCESCGGTGESPCLDAPCGNPGQDCCAGPTNACLDFLVCTTNGCDVSCGKQDEACCVESTACEGTLRCTTFGQCASSCGQAQEPCCADAEPCGLGLTCNSGWCG